MILKKLQKKIIYDAAKILKSRKCPEKNDHLALMYLKKKIIYFKNTKKSKNSKNTIFFIKSPEKIAINLSSGENLETGTA